MYQKKWPCGFKIIQNMNFDNKHLDKIAALVDIKKLSPLHAAKVWLKSNLDIWQNWLPKQNCK